MNFSRSLSLLAVALLWPAAAGRGADGPVSAPPASAATELAKLQAAEQTAIETIAAEREKWIAALETWYQAGLDKLLAERTKAGDLDGTIAVKDERTRLTAHDETTPEQIQAMPAALRTLRDMFESSRQKIAAEVTRRNEAFAKKYLADLDAAEKRLTMAGAIDDAIAMRKEKERFVSDQALANGAPIAPAGSPPISAGPPPSVAPSLSPVPVPAPLATPPPDAKTAQVLAILVGRWRITNPAAHTAFTRTFKTDGTFTGENFDGIGKWQIVEGGVELSYPSGRLDTFALPLDPKGSKVTLTRQGPALRSKPDGVPLHAVREEPPPR